MKPLLLTLILFGCSTPPEPPQPKTTYTFGTADTVFSERQKIVYNEIWEK